MCYRQCEQDLQYVLRVSPCLSYGLSTIRKTFTPSVLQQHKCANCTLDLSRSSFPHRRRGARLFLHQLSGQWLPQSILAGTGKQGAELCREESRGLQLLTANLLDTQGDLSQALGKEVSPRRYRAEGFIQRLYDTGGALIDASSHSGNSSGDRAIWVGGARLALFLRHGFLEMLRRLQSRLLVDNAVVHDGLRDQSLVLEGQVRKQEEREHRVHGGETPRLVQAVRVVCVDVPGSNTEQRGRVGRQLLIGPAVDVGGKDLATLGGGVDGAADTDAVLAHAAAFLLHWVVAVHEAEFGEDAAEH
mmetsp:Transcript_15218/g.32382  ORF Transcript_15218/g.32382 Transcript_15218/m.32382 type:complete len:303 (-) Transcript_15218:145-1053(-)